MGLIQTYSLVFHSPPGKMSEDAQVELVLQVLQVLKRFDPSVFPAFEKARSKKNAIPFDCTADRVRELIRKNVNREGKTYFPELGSDFGFFSSMDDDRMAGISFTVGAQRWPANNSFILDFPIKPSIIDKESPFTPSRVWELFVELVLAFNPQLGSLRNAVNRQRYWHIEQSHQDSRPITIDWMNYFNPLVMEFIGRKRFERLSAVQLEDFQGGFLIRLLDEPFDDSNPEHLDRQRKVNQRLGLLGA